MAAARHILLISLLAFSACGADYYCSPTGSGTGTLLSPFAWTNAFTNLTITAGDTLWLRSGTYGTGGQDGADIRIRGTPASRLTIRNYTGERAVMNGNFALYGSNVTVWGLDFTNSASAVTRTNSMVYSLYSYPGSGGLKLINCTFYNTVKFFLTLGSDSDREIYGNLFYAIGDFEGNPLAPPRGPALYMQNQSNTVFVTDNIVAKGWTEGFKCYGESVKADNFVHAGNVAYLCNWYNYHASQPNLPFSFLAYSNNVSYLSKQINCIGYQGGVFMGAHGKLIWAGNYLVQDMAGYNYGNGLAGFTNLWATNNTFAQISTDSEASKSSLLVVWPTNAASYVVDGNQYWGDRNATGPNRYGTTSSPTARTWDYWTNTLSWDLNGAWHSNSWPTENAVIVRTNKYEAGRAHIVVFNWQSNDVQAVSLDNCNLASGQAWSIVDAQDYFGTAITNGTYTAGQSVNVSLTNTAVTPVQGEHSNFTRDIDSHTDKLFNVFVLLPGALGTPAGPGTVGSTIGAARLGAGRF